MQHAVKYRLVPESILNSSLPAPPAVDRVEEMRRELIALLDDPRMEGFKKRALYEDLLHRFKTFREHIADPIPRRSPPPSLPQPPPDVVSAPRRQQKRPKMPKRVRRPRVMPTKDDDDLHTAVEDDLRTARDYDSDLSSVTARSESENDNAEIAQMVKRIRQTQRKTANKLEKAEVDEEKEKSRTKSRKTERLHKRPREAHKTVGSYRLPKTWEDYQKRAQKGKGGQRFTVRKWTAF